MRVEFEDCFVAVVAAEGEVLAAVEHEGHPAGESHAEQQGAGEGGAGGGVL